uniref:Putative LAGLIDADG homing endonuclease n=1 Tax=Characiochloris acuminata TaxID=167768 RepID=A0A0S2LPL6_9CHLO|nr:putative LAGLIDADG homing endonuclease [Characiochloris acuminata]YP_009185090.1 putative LAGLIDADG homing endonuclease [Characiochloris acuminata]ALO63326.1 putative LAGLIDADG homing endonuclease [Characiochloris acuminata]ALO63330.1 putative LAGLIDADG homing endonuclease [Characiochloris acuminata]
MTANLNAQWIVGFVDGEGCFYVGVIKNKTMTNGYQIQPEFTVVQHKRDIQLLAALKAYFGCGSVGVNHGDRYHWRVKNLDHFINIIIPFFEKHKLKGKRAIEFQRFREICLLMKQSYHLTPAGFEEIRTKAINLRVRN